jgi:hypothetical protein
MRRRTDHKCGPAGVGDRRVEEGKLVEVSMTTDGDQSHVIGVNVKWIGISARVQGYFDFNLKLPHRLRRAF